MSLLKNAEDFEKYTTQVNSLTKQLKNKEDELEIERKIANNLSQRLSRYERILSRIAEIIPSEATIGLGTLRHPASGSSADA